MNNCKGCGKIIVWGIMGNTRIPLDTIAPVYTFTGAGSEVERADKSFVSHFVTCPKRDDFRKEKEKS